MRELEAVLLVRRLGLRPALPHDARHVFVSEKWVSSGVLCSSEREEFFNESWMWHRLVGLQRRIKS
jgi:hypothetical protein